MKHFLKVHGELHLDLLPHCVLVLAVCFHGTLLSLGVDVGALPFIPWSAGVCGFSTSNVIGLILFKLNPMSFSSKDLNLEKEPDLLICGCLLSLCMITCISLLVEVTSSFAVSDDLISICLLKVIAAREITWNRN